MEKAMRENGYYWVKTYGEWIIAQWNGVYWWFIADDDWYDEDYVKEIGEKVERKEKSIVHIAFAGDMESVMPVMVFRNEGKAKAFEARYRKKHAEGKRGYERDFSHISAYEVEQ